MSTPILGHSSPVTKILAAARQGSCIWSTSLGVIVHQDWNGMTASQSDQAVSMHTWCSFRNATQSGPTAIMLQDEIC